DGWFKPLDNDRWLIRYTPRRKKSNWSKYNIATAWNLLNENKMTPAGVARLPKDVFEVWEKHRPHATVIVRVTQGRGITFADGAGGILTHDHWCPRPVFATFAGHA